MSSLKSIVGLVLLGLLIVQPGHAQESEDCPYPKGREIQDLAAALAAHEVRDEAAKKGDTDVPGRANFCNADLFEANLQGADLRWANLEGAALCGANLNQAILYLTILQDAKLSNADLSNALYQPINVTAPVDRLK